MCNKLIFFVLKIIFFFNILYFTRGDMNISNTKNESDYISLDKHNISDFTNIKENAFLFNITCSITNLIHNFKGFLSSTRRSYNDVIEGLKPDYIDLDYMSDIERLIEKTWDNENKEFIYTVKEFIRENADDDLFILQIGLNSIAPLILDNPEYTTFIEENVEVCKSFFQHKLNRCLLNVNEVKFYCKQTDKHASNKHEQLYETLKLITRIHQDKNNQVVDILFINHEFPVALLYYMFPYVDSSTLVIIMDNLNHKMKSAIFEYFDFIGEADFSKTFEREYYDKKKKQAKAEKKEQNAYEASGDTYIYTKMKQSPFYILALKPKLKINPPEDIYKNFISIEYTSSHITEIRNMIKDIKKNLKTNEDLYEKNIVEISNYFSVINEYDFESNNNNIKDKVKNILSSILKEPSDTGGVNEKNFRNALLNLKNIFEFMLLHVYENSKFKSLFVPLIEYKSRLDKNDNNYILYQLFIYSLIKNSYELESYELKELLFLDILRDVSKKVDNMSLKEMFELLIRLNIILKKFRSRANIEHIREYAKRNLELEYSNYEL